LHDVSLNGAGRGVGATSDGGWRRAAAVPICAAMARLNHRIVVIGRLMAKPLAAGQLLCVLALTGLLIRQAEGEGAVEIVRHILFGNLMVTALIGVAALGLLNFHRLWRQRETYIWHDGARLYRGSSDSWPLSLIRDVVITRNEIGIESLRLIVDDDSEVTRELVKLALLADPPEAVRGGVMFAVAGVRGFPAGSVLN
jgi:hypothetical protein